MCRSHEAKNIIFIKSELRRNILDMFNKEGIEIMSPSVTSIREPDKPMIPPEYNPEPFSFIRRKRN